MAELTGKDKICVFYYIQQIERSERMKKELEHCSSSANGDRILKRAYMISKKSFENFKAYLKNLCERSGYDKQTIMNQVYDMAYNPEKAKLELNLENNFELMKMAEDNKLEFDYKIHFDNMRGHICDIFQDEKFSLSE